MQSGGRHIPNMIDNIHLGAKRRLASHCVVSDSEVRTRELAWELTRHQIWRPTDRLPPAPCCLHGHGSCSDFSHPALLWFQSVTDPRDPMQQLFKMFLFSVIISRGVFWMLSTTWWSLAAKTQCVDRLLSRTWLDFPGDTEGLV